MMSLGVIIGIFATLAAEFIFCVIFALIERNENNGDN